MSTDDLKKDLLNKIKVLNETTWESRSGNKKIESWLSNFEEDEQIQVLFLLSRFMYFGSIQMRNLLKSLYRDLFKYRIIERIRKENGDTRDLKFINSSFENEQRKTRFLGMGNPSESGPHLLYFFRQENEMSKKLFIHTHEIFSYDGTTLKSNLPDVKHFVFIDDFCGSGSQAMNYSKVVRNIKNVNKDAEVSYLMLFATKEGKENVRDNTLFDFVESVFELDKSFKCFESDSRVFDNKPTLIDQKLAEEISLKYGSSLMKFICEKEVDPSEVDNCAIKNAHGFGDGQLLVGFHHNTPDNTLPIFWYDEKDPGWIPMFKRYNKKYGF